MSDINVAIQDEIPIEVGITDGNTIEVSIDSPGITTLGGLSDVTIVGTPNNGSFLRYISSPGTWANSVYTPDLTTTNQNTFDIRTNENMGIVGFNGFVNIGDIDGYGNFTHIVVDDDSGNIYFHADNGFVESNAPFSAPLVTTGALSLSQSFNATIKSVAATYPVLATDYIIVATANTFTITLPNAVAFLQSKIYIIKNSGAGTITVATSAGQTIDGSATQTLTSNQRITVASLSGNWVIIG
jgi:hypothetical protein